MLKDGQVWRNGTKLAQVIHPQDAQFKAAVFAIIGNNLQFSIVIDDPDETYFLDHGFKLSDEVFVLEDNN
jgi:hypothetical protein